MTRAAWNHNIHYHPLVLDAVPKNCERALDAGCGEGLLASKLAERCGAVVGIDCDHETLVRARTTYAGEPRITFLEGDVLTAPLPAGGFQFIATVATLHHLDARAALVRFRELLAPGGVLSIIGLSRPESARDWLWSAAGVVACRLIHPFHNFVEVSAPLCDPDETTAELQALFREILPGGEFRRRLLFRYSYQWQKPL